MCIYNVHTQKSALKYPEFAASMKQITENPKHEYGFPSTYC